MQSYSNPDLFFCPLYNAPGVADPVMGMCGSDDQYFNQDSSWLTSSPSSTGALSFPSSTSMSRSSSRDSSLSPPGTPSSSRGSDRGSAAKLDKYKRMSAKAGKSLLEFATELEGRRITHEKRKQLNASQTSRNSSDTERSRSPSSHS